MTTLAWDGKTLAGDGLTTSDQLIIRTNAEKVFKLSGPDLTILSGCTGAVQQIEKFKDLLQGVLRESSTESAVKSLKVGNIQFDDGFQAIIIFRSGVDLRLFRVETMVYPVEYKTDKMAIGCGQEFALAAMDHGKTAPEAVEYAATRNVYTGGLITVVDFGESHE